MEANEGSVPMENQDHSASEGQTGQVQVETEVNEPTPTQEPVEQQEPYQQLSPPAEPEPEQSQPTSTAASPPPPPYQSNQPPVTEASEAEVGSSKQDEKQKVKKESEPLPQRPLEKNEDKPVTKIPVEEAEPEEIKDSKKSKSKKNKVQPKSQPESKPAANQKAEPEAFVATKAEPGMGSSVHSDKKEKEAQLTKIDLAPKQETKEPREQYDNLFQYLLACIGFAVGLGNVWRFPKVALENGGGAFIIPWVIVIIIQGIPLMMVELVIGQRFRGGPLHSYGRMNKLCWGIGASMGFVSVYLSLFYNSILSWGFMYFFNSFTKDLPWLSCPVQHMNNTECISNPARFYYDYSIVNWAPSLEEGSGVIWPLYFATAFAWLVVFLAMMAGVQSVGKVIYFTALYPYLMLTILFFIGVTSDGAEHGLEYLFDPDWSKMADFRVWQAASEQVFFSASLAFGGLIAIASYMPVKNNTMRDAIIIVVVNSLTSLYAAFGIFSIKGHMAKDEYTRCQEDLIPGCNKTLVIKDYVAQDDSSAGLVFISMAKALDLIDDTEYGASVLSMMFYLMIITLGLDSAFGSLEGYLSILKDFGVMKKVGYKWVLCICCACSGIFAMLFASVHGTYFIDIFDKYGCVLVLVFVGLFEFISVGWIYGFNNFTRDFKLLTDMKLPVPFMILIKYVGPLTILITLVGQFVLEAEDDKFLTYLDGEALPWWAQVIAMLLFLSAAIWFPLGVITTCYINRARKSFDWGEIDFDYEELKKDLKPSENPRWQQLVFFLDKYDYPENLGNLEDPDPKQSSGAQFV